MNEVTITKAKRGFFGKFWAFLFWSWHVLCGLWIYGGIQNAAALTATYTTEAQIAGAAIGTSLGVGFIVILWFIVTVFLGLCVLMTKPKYITSASK